MKNEKPKIKSWWSISILFFLGAIFGVLSSGIAAGFPTKPITLICIYDAGSSADLAVRPLADILYKELGQRVIVVNKVGGAGTLGITELSKAAPDGYTIGMLTFSPMAITPHLMKVGFKLDDFDYFGSWGEWVYGLVSSGKRPWKDVKDVIDYAKANPGKLKHGWASHANALPMLLLAEKENLDVKFIPTSGGGESESFLAGGHTDTDCRHPGVIKSFTEDMIRFLHPCGNRRWDLWGRSDRPTLMELGYDIDVRSFIGLGAPKGLPANVKKTLIDALRKAASDKLTKDIMFKLGFYPTWIEGTEYEKFIKEGYIKIGPLVEKLKK
ncbi:MAG: tripartite tricarboxylate transporter substrate binding protein [Deltaproteobacteria bacterium]|nr:tripartite tricarboxylate transporter substrate binding protein [Deltaproteobacteria bacterium]